MKSLSVQQVILKWISNNLKLVNSFLFSSVEVQHDIVEYGKRIGVWHTPDLYSRQWRKIREEIRSGRDYGFTVEEIEKKGKVVKWYKVMGNITK